MQAISVLQPWAWAIARGHKPVVNRAWTTDHRGRLLIHAAMRVDLAACDSTLIREAGWDAADPLATFGAIVAVADLVDVCPGHDGVPTPEPASCGCGAWSEPGAFHWRLTDVRPLPRPVIALGRLVGLWEPRAGVLGQVRELALS